MLILVLIFTIQLKAQIYFSRDQLLTTYKDYIVDVEKDIITFEKDGFTFICYIDEVTDKCLDVYQSKEGWDNDSLVNYLSSDPRCKRVSINSWVYSWVERNGEQINFLIYIFKHDDGYMYPIIRYLYLYPSTN